MALELPFGIQPVNPVPVDFWSGPYTGALTQEAIDSANSGIPSAVRFQSLEVRLVINGVAEKYWYATGIADTDLSPINTVVGAGNRAFNNITSDFSMSSVDNIVFADSTSGPINVYIPTAVGVGGKEIMIKMTAGANTVLVNASGAQTVDGESSQSIDHAFQSLSLISNNSNWFIS